LDIQLTCNGADLRRLWADGLGVRPGGRAVADASPRRWLSRGDRQFDHFHESMIAS
jgi:hypothetical protein